jgi:hypothetical protein
LPVDEKQIPHAIPHFRWINLQAHTHKDKRCKQQGITYTLDNQLFTTCSFFNQPGTPTYSGKIQGAAESISIKQVCLIFIATP